MDAVALKKTLVQWQVKETVLVLAASVMMPFVAHLFPLVGGIPLGARLLPMFYAPLIAVILFRPHVAIITALLSPSLNSLLTGHPVPEIVAVLTAELLLFSAIAHLIYARRRHFWAVAPLAYLATLLSVSCLLRSVNFFLITAVNALPGLAILTLINILWCRKV